MGFDRRNIKGRWNFGTKTASAGTAITQLIPPKSNAKAVLSALTYKCGATPHTLSFLRSQGNTVTTAAAASGDSTITLATVTIAKDLKGNSLSEDLAANDFVAVLHSDGSWGEYKVSSVSGLVVTLASTLTKAVDSGATVHGFYEVARTTGTPSIQITIPTASAINIFPGGGATPSGVDGEVGVASGLNANEPLLIHSDNATAAGSIVCGAAVYLDL